jgi:hypothetical protein
MYGDERNLENLLRDQVKTYFEILETVTVNDITVTVKPKTQSVKYVL